jgi:hypothetical protein
MTTRDRTVLMVVVVLAIVAGGWILVVSPKRKEANKLSEQVTAAQSTLSAAEGKLNDARNAQRQYASAYASIVSLGKAVPPTTEVPSLIYQLEGASNGRHVEFASISAGSAGSSTSSSTTTASPSGTAAAAAGFTQMPFTFVFNGSFVDLEHLFSSIDHFTLRGPKGSVRVSGRLLTIQGVKLTPQGAAAAGSKNVKLSGTITAVAYVLPGTQGVTGGATPSSPSGSTSSAGSSSSSTPATPAVVTP